MALVYSLLVGKEGTEGRGSEGGWLGEAGQEVDEKEGRYSGTLQKKIKICVLSRCKKLRVSSRLDPESAPKS